MKKVNVFISFIVLIFIASCVSSVDESTNEAEPLQFKLTNLHLFDSTLNVTESEVLEFLNELNDAIAEIGYPGAGYKLWKVQNDTIMQYRFMIKSSWPDKTAYDSIHNHEAYKAAQEKYSDFAKQIRKQTVYQKYELVE